jgi:hypothetical protein
VTPSSPAIHGQRKKRRRRDSQTRRRRKEGSIHARWGKHRRVAFSRAAAIAFVESCWELIADDPEVWYSLERFVETGGVEEMQRQYYPSL